MAKPDYDVTAPLNHLTNVDGTEGGKTLWHKIGVAWDTEKGIRVVVNSIPLNWDGQLYLFPVKKDG